MPVITLDMKQDFLKYPAPPDDWSYPIEDWYSYCHDMEDMDLAYQRAVFDYDNEEMPF